MCTNTDTRKQTQNCTKQSFSEWKILLHDVYGDKKDKNSRFSFQEIKQWKGGMRFKMHFNGIDKSYNVDLIMEGNKGNKIFA